MAKPETACGSSGKNNAVHPNNSATTSSNSKASSYQNVFLAKKYCKHGVDNYVYVQLDDKIMKAFNLKDKTTK